MPRFWSCRVPAVSRLGGAGLALCGAEFVRCRGPGPCRAGFGPCRAGFALGRAGFGLGSGWVRAGFGLGSGWVRAGSCWVVLGSGRVVPSRRMVRLWLGRDRVVRCSWWFRLRLGRGFAVARRHPGRAPARAALTLSRRRTRAPPHREATQHAPAPALSPRLQAVVGLCVAPERCAKRCPCVSRCSLGQPVPLCQSVLWVSRCPWVSQCPGSSDALGHPMPWVIRCPWVSQCPSWVTPPCCTCDRSPLMVPRVYLVFAVLAGTRTEPSFWCTRYTRRPHLSHSFRRWRARSVPDHAAITAYLACAAVTVYMCSLR